MRIRAPFHRLRPLALALTTLVFAVAAAPAAAQADRFTAQAANLSNVGPQGAWGPLDIVVNRYSTEDERNRFLAVLAERGPDGLLEAFRRAPSIGRIGPPGSLDFEIRYAHQMPTEDGGRRVILATDRLMSFLEVRNQPMTVDYPFTVVELRLDKDGEGRGDASLFTRIDVDKRNNTLILENLANQPVSLMSVRSLGRSQ
jgi:hypothetical protein